MQTLQEIIERMDALRAERETLLAKLNEANNTLRTIKQRQQNARSLSQQTRNDDDHKRTLYGVHMIQNRLSAIKGLIAILQVQRHQVIQAQAQASRQEAA